jgi:hypothetical protein
MYAKNQDFKKIIETFYYFLEILLKIMEGGHITNGRSEISEWR